MIYIIEDDYSSFLCSWDAGTVADQKLLSAMSSWDYLEYARRYSG